MVDQDGSAVYPAYWEADVVLRDGGTAHLRPVSPADADAVQEFHQAQSQDSIYLRFFTYKSKLSAKELKRFTEVDHRDRVAFVATMAGAIIGIARYDRLADPAEAEVAFNISDHHQGRGLGSILLEHLAAAARENGVRKFTAEVLPENRKMLQVFADAGYEVRRHFDDGVVSLSFDIDPTEKSRAVMEAREHRAEARSVAGLLAPASVAVIGAGADWGSVGRQVLAHIVEGGFRGPVFAINSELLELAGLMAYGSISEVPGPVDLAVIAVPYADVAAVVAECGAAGVKGVVVATAGYADDGARGLGRQRELVRLARSHGMRVVGPESLGLANTVPAVSLNASLVPGLPRRGSLGLFSQSAAIGVALYATTNRRNVGVSSMLSAGNRADVSGNDLMQYWEDDPDTAACAMYLESFGNPRKFSRLARRLSKTKPVLVAKSEVMGLQVPPGHAVRTTQAPQGAVDAMLRQSGVIRVETVEELVEVGQLLVSQPLPAGSTVCVLSNSLALGTVVADSALAHGLSVGGTEARLELHTGQPVALPELRSRLLAALAPGHISAAVVALLPERGLSVETIAAVLAQCSALAAKPVVAAFTGIPDPAIRVDGLLGSGTATVPCYASPGAAVAALAAVCRYAAWLHRDQGTFDVPAGMDAQAVDWLLAERLRDERGDALHRLEPAAAAALLANYGIEVQRSVAFSTADQAVAAARSLGWPVALKTTDPTLRHRLDLGGVRLNIPDEASLRRNIDLMARLLAPYGTFGMEVQAMAPAGQSCVLRAIEDPLLGPVVSFGVAGDAVNLLDDWAHRIPPLTGTDVAELVRSPKAARKLLGYEGLPAADLAAVEDLVARLAALKDRHPEIALVEFNPVLAGSGGLAILGADVRIANAAQRTDSARRAMAG